ncbi:glycosyltransferase family 25 protein [Daldinia loculata]|uniref:glycosyltransferase family 25 protein n=1 Tax=Daldinia loculata TaxID=103429 RepID=UPI0020C2F1EA|nr:glycosyltransferase family 25 protein [Daldinia loculata]KAI1648669.1 glycosyltransferase family 25 protein [Daldinia loculata]
MMQSSWTNHGTTMRNRRSIALAVILLILSLWLLQSRFDVYSQLHNGPNFRIKQSPRETAANATLGFQKLVALSNKPSWRTRGLEAAAKLTDLEFTIPPQGQNSDELVEAFRNLGADKKGAKLPAPGSAKAWLAHLDLLKYVIASGFETAFIVEDDVDWDVRIKAEMRLVSDNVRAYMGVAEDDPTPFGTDWDVLWLGHCGSSITDDLPPPRVFADDTRCETPLYSGWSKRFLRDKLTEGHRQVQAAHMTVCTFGFGVTKKGAQKMVPLLSRGGNEAFDVALSGYCKKEKLKCIVVNPQLFNHYEPPADLGYVSDVHVGDGHSEGSDDSSFEHTKGTTGNIMKSARCDALFHDVCMRPPSEI